MHAGCSAVCAEKKKTHEAFIERGEEGRVVRQRLADALEDVKLTGGALFKVGHVVLCKDLLSLRKDRDEKAQKTTADAILKFVDRYNKRLEDYKTIIDLQKKKTHTQFQSSRFG